MGIVAFWGPIHGQGKMSVNASLLSSYIALTNQKQVLAMDSQFTYGRLQDIMCRDAEDGISQIFTYANTDNLTVESFKIYTTSVIEKKLYILGATKQQLVSDYLSGCFNSILKCADDCYDLVFIDTNAGIYDSNTVAVLENADLIVVNLPQEGYVLEKFFNREEGYWHPVLDQRNCIHVIGGYQDNYDHYTTTKIKRRFDLKELYAVPNSKFVHKSIIEQRFMQWMISNYDSDRNDENAYLFHSINEIAERIVGLPRKQGLFAILSKKVKE